MHTCQTTKQILAFHLSLRSLWGLLHWEYNYSDGSFSLFHNQSFCFLEDFASPWGGVAGGITESRRNKVNQVRESQWKGQNERVSLSIMSDSATPWSIAHQVFLSMEFSRRNTGVGSHSFSRRSSWTRDQTWVSCIAGEFFTIWVTRFKKTSEKARVKHNLKSPQWENFCESPGSWRSYRSNQGSTQETRSRYREPQTRL